MKALAVDGLTKRYGSVKAVEDVTFHIERGEVFGYLGPNGSGKTTTLRCLMGFLRPTQEALAERLEVDLDRRVETLSKGNRQKIGVISAFQHQPDLLVLDEPTSGLDPLMRQVVLELIREATKVGATVLLSSHDLSEVSAICERAAILREGRLVEVAPISQIVQRGERRLKVWFVEKSPQPSGIPDDLTGVRIVEQNGNTQEIAYQGRADALLKWLAQYHVDRITTPQTSLEEAFMQYYQGKTNRD